MEPTIARAVSDACIRRNHPRLDFRTEEGRHYAMRLAPFLEPIIHHGIRALDLGCSTGKSTFALCELGAQVTGIDVSFSALRFSSTIGGSIHATVRHIAADYTRLPFCSGYFELAIFPHNVVECSPEEFKKIITETYRVLAVGGHFALSVSNKWCGGNPDQEPIRKESTITIEGQDTYAYPTYSWSVKSVVQFVSCQFRLESEAQMKNPNSVWLVFCKS